MANAVEIVLDRPREVRFTFADLKSLQTRLAKPVAQILADMGQLDVLAIQYLLYTGLRHGDSRLRFDDVSDMIEKYIASGKTLGDILYVLNEALVQSGFFGREGVSKADAPAE